MSSGLVRAAMIVILCAACSRGGGENHDTAVGAEGSPVGSPPSSTVVSPTGSVPGSVPAKKPVTGERAEANPTLPSRVRVPRKADSVLGRDSAIQLPRRTLPLAKPRTP